jgi:hypothetical protein
MKGKLVIAVILVTVGLTCGDAAAQGPTRSTFGQVYNSWQGYQGAVSNYRTGRGTVGQVNGAYNSYQTRLHTYQGGGGSRYWAGGSGW